MEYPDGIISSQKSPVVAGLFAFCNFYLSVRYDHMKAIEYIFLPSRVYRGEIEQQLDACYSLEEAHDLVVKNAGELYQGCTPEEMREMRIALAPVMTLMLSDKSAPSPRSANRSERTVSQGWLRFKVRE